MHCGSVKHALFTVKDAAAKKQTESDTVIVGVQGSLLIEQILQRDAV